MTMPLDDEIGPFPQFAIYITTQAGTVRQDVHGNRHAFRIVAAAASCMMGIEFDDPFPDGPGFGLSFAGSRPEEITRVSVMRVNDRNEYRALPPEG
ncbi:MAG TPA: hypothetical protein VGD01_04405 [Candidatus Elarobacter sp.]|jgi:hypothetical protein